MGKHETLSEARGGMRRLAIASGCCLAAEGLLEVVLGVWAYREGGPGLVALLAAVLFLPAAVTTPVLMVLAERSTHAERVLRSVAIGCAALVVGTAGVMSMDRSGPLVILLAAAGVSLGTLFRPLKSGLLPWLARTPEELITGHGWSTIAENVGTLAGPVAGAICLAGSGPTLGVIVASTILLLSSAMMLGVRPQQQRADTSTRAGVRTLVTRLGEGARIASDPPGLLVFVLLRTLVAGALDVLIVVRPVH